MSLPVISLENVSKSYLIGHQQKGVENTLRDKIAAATKSIIRRGVGHSEPSGELFWALKDISFDVHQGDRLAIIGSNGAGKSTLFKLLSRITTPSKGKITIEGKVASLLEVGTGFHPELTGRENIFLNGRILGMKRREIQHKFDEIVAFSGIEFFLDTPVKRFSSGMYVRLAFAVAAHLDSEILILDEVLAVGDTEFQNKCFGKMQDITRSGRTILFVSHNMLSVRNMCTHGIYLHQGSLIIKGEIDDVINQYFSNTNASIKKISEIAGRNGNGLLRFIDGSVSGEENKVELFKEMQIFLEYSLSFPTAKIDEYKIEIEIINSFGQRVALLSSSTKNQWIDISKNNIDFTIKNISLVPGVYKCNLFAEVNSQLSDAVYGVLTFTIVENDNFQYRYHQSYDHSLILLQYAVK